MTKYQKTLYSKRHPKAKKNNEFNILTIDRVNKNGRLYTKRTVFEAIQKWGSSVSPKFGTFIDDCDYRGIIHLDKVSHLIENVHLEGDHLVATIQVLKTPQGKVLEDLLDQDLVEFHTSGSCTGFGAGGEVIGWEMISVNAVCKGRGA